MNAGRGALLLAASLSAWGADFPKNGSFAATHAVTATSPAAFDLGAGRWAAIFEARVISTNDAGTGMFHNLAGHCIGFDMSSQLTGTCIWVDRDGDRFVETITREAGGPRGAGVLISGTGKYTGIEGSLDFVEAPPLADTAPGQRNLVSKVKGRYRIP